MASNQRATQEKRRRERAKQEAQAEKEQSRVLRKEQKKLRAENLVDGEDPDLIGIVHGPQPGQFDEEED